ncbi:MAG: hypothetical protein P8X42_05025 [Calditrichaceae bacterium]
MKQSTYFILILALMVGSASAQVEFSDAFKETLQKIVKENVQKGVINWLTEEEPVIGVVGRDLIGQVINSADKDELVGSVTNVVTSSVFIYNVQSVIKKSTPDTLYNNILKQAKDVGWNEKKLLAYSGLYFYYSERLKFNLYISPYIFTMEDVKRKIESFDAGRRKWVTEVSRLLVKQRRDSKNIALDVRLLEILRVSLLNRIQPGKQVQIDSTLIEELIDYYTPVESEDLMKLISLWRNGEQEESLKLLFKVFTVSVQREVGGKIAKGEINSLSFDLKVLSELLSNYVYLVNGYTSGYFDNQNFELNTLRTTSELINNWIEEYNNNKFRFDYGIMLASSYVDKSEEVRFIVQDQLRLGYFKQKLGVFLYLSGVIDPLLQEAFDTKTKVYLGGLGVKYGRFNINIGAGVPYEDLKIENVKAAFGLGYDIPLLDVNNGME